ncbi:hypothetical protein ACFYR1_40760 [Streptomyces canus]|uniref:hypothetical protein n=1 Tax=Streptomyces canus TaxID=58343 RepID=UPI0036A75039
MTDLTPPPMPSFPPPPPTPKKSRTSLVIIASAAAVIAAVVATGIVVVQSTGDDSKSSAPTKPAAAAAAAPDPTPTYDEVTADSFTIKLKTKSRQCFGSAGCNLTVEPDLTYVGLGDIDPDATYEITYEIHGDESGPVIETAELSDQTSLNYTPSVISTVSSGTKVSVEITDVTAQGE